MFLEIKTRVIRSQFDKGAIEQMFLSHKKRRKKYSMSKLFTPKLRKRIRTILIYIFHSIMRIHNIRLLLERTIANNFELLNIEFIHRTRIIFVEKFIIDLYDIF